MSIQPQTAPPLLYNAVWWDGTPPPHCISCFARAQRGRCLLTGSTHGQLVIWHEKDEVVSSKDVNVNRKEQATLLEQNQNHNHHYNVNDDIKCTYTPSAILLRTTTTRQYHHHSHSFTGHGAINTHSISDTPIDSAAVINIFTIVIDNLEVFVVAYADGTIQTWTTNGGECLVTTRLSPPLTLTTASESGLFPITSVLKSFQPILSAPRPTFICAYKSNNCISIISSSFSVLAYLKHDCQVIFQQASKVSNEIYTITKSNELHFWNVDKLLLDNQAPTPRDSKPQQPETITSSHTISLPPLSDYDHIVSICVSDSKENSLLLITTTNELVIVDVQSRNLLTRSRVTDHLNSHINHFANADSKNEKETIPIKKQVMLLDARFLNHDKHVLVKTNRDTLYVYRLKVEENVLSSFLSPVIILLTPEFSYRPHSEQYLTSLKVFDRRITAGTAAGELWQWYLDDRALLLPSNEPYQQLLPMHISSLSSAFSSSDNQCDLSGLLLASDPDTSTSLSLTLVQALRNAQITLTPLIDSHKADRKLSAPIVLSLHDSPIKSMLIIPSNESLSGKAYIVTVDKSNRMVIWDINAANAVYSHHFSTGITSLSRSSSAIDETAPESTVDDWISIICEDRSVRILSLSQLTIIAVLRGHDSIVTSVFRPYRLIQAGFLLTQTTVGSVYVWNVCGTGELEFCAYSDEGIQYLDHMKKSDSTFVDTDEDEIPLRRSSSIQSYLSAKRRENSSEQLTELRRSLSHEHMSDQAKGASVPSVKAVPSTPDTPPKETPSHRASTHKRSWSIKSLVKRPSVALFKKKDKPKEISEVAAKREVVNADVEDDTPDFDNTALIPQMMSFPSLRFTMASFSIHDWCIFIRSQYVSLLEVYASNTESSHSAELLRGFLAMLFSHSPSSIATTLASFSLKESTLPMSVAYEASPHSLVVLFPNTATTLSDRFNFSSILSSLISVTNTAILNSCLLSAEPKARASFLQIDEAFAETIPIQSYAPFSYHTISTYAIPTIAQYALDSNVDIHVPARILLRRAINEIDDQQRKACAILFSSMYSWPLSHAAIFPLESMNDKKKKSVFGASGLLNSINAKTFVTLPNITTPPPALSRAVSFPFSAPHTSQAMLPLEEFTQTLYCAIVNSSTEPSDVSLDEMSAALVLSYIHMFTLKSMYQTPADGVNDGDASHHSNGSSTPASPRRKELQQIVQDKSSYILRTLLRVLVSYQDHGEDSISKEPSKWRSWCLLALQLFRSCISILVSAFIIQDVSGLTHKLIHFVASTDDDLSNVSQHVLTELSVHFGSQMMTITCWYINSSLSASIRAAAACCLCWILRRSSNVSWDDGIATSILTLLKCINADDQALREQIIGYLTQIFTELSNRFPLFSFHPSEAHVAIASSSLPFSIQVYDGHTGHKVRLLEGGHKHVIDILEFSPDGSFLASYCSQDSPPSARVWSAYPHAVSTAASRGSIFGALRPDRHHCVKVFPLPAILLSKEDSGASGISIKWKDSNSFTLRRENGSKVELKM